MLTRTTVWRRQHNRNTENNGSNPTSWKNNVSSSVISSELEAWPRLVLLERERVLADIGVTEGVPDRCLPFPFFFPLSVWNRSGQESSPFPTWVGDPAETGSKSKWALLVGGVANIAHGGEARTDPKSEMQSEAMTGDVCGHCVGFKCSQIYVNNTKPQPLLVKNEKEKQEMNMLSHVAIKTKGLIQEGKRIFELSALTNNTYAFVTILLDLFWLNIKGHN